MRGAVGMSKSKHTPGPWACCIPKSNEYVAIVAGELAVASVNTACGLDGTLLPCEANANLIAAAPDLFDACEAMLQGRRSISQAIKMARAAVEKAKGEAS